MNKHDVEILVRTCIDMLGTTTNASGNLCYVIARRQQISRDTESFLLVGELLPVPDSFFFFSLFPPAKFLKVFIGNFERKSGLRKHSFWDDLILQPLGEKEGAAVLGQRPKSCHLSEDANRIPSRAESSQAPG